MRRPVDPAVAAAAAGKAVPERSRSDPSLHRPSRQHNRGPPLDDDESDAMSIGMFCRRYGISESFFHKLMAQGQGPRVMRVGKRTLISREASRAWRRKWEAQSRSA